MLLPPLIDVIEQLAANLGGLLFTMGLFQPDKGRVRIAVDHLVTFSFDQLPRLAHDLVAAQGDRRGQSGIEEATAARSQHAVERIHDDLERLR
ncbi:hypothetical protein D3C80_1488460 [compost metagenome]